MSKALGQWRERISLTHTIKDGWRVGDATIEFTESATIGGEIDREERRKRLRDMIEDGEMVAAELDRQKAIATTTNVTASGNRREHHND